MRVSRKGGIIETVSEVNLGMPTKSLSAREPLAPRQHTRKIQVGSVAVGGDAPVSVQSMTTTLTSDVEATLRTTRRPRLGRLITERLPTKTVAAA